MKKLMPFVFLLTLLTVSSNAQTISIPTFSNEIVVMNVNINPLSNQTSYVSITDGLVNFSMDLKKYAQKREDESNGFYPQIADIMSQLKKQGFRLITSESPFLGKSVHYFQKE